MSQFKNLILSLGLILTPFLAAAECADCTFDLPVASARCGKNQVGCGDRTERREERAARRFKLKDFEGNWALTVKGVGGVTGDEAIGYSFTSDGQLSINQCGFGVVNHYQGVIYAGVPGEVIHFSATPRVPTLVLEITDPLIGIGRITITDPEQGGVVQVVDFIAVRSAKSGLVLQLEGHGTSSSSTTQAIATYTLIRQDL